VLRKAVEPKRKVTEAFSKSNIIIIIKSKRRGWAGHVTSMEEGRCHKPFAENP
jgi:hypothetical protein